MTGPERLVPRAEDFPDAVVWRPLDDPAAELIAYRPGEAFEPDLPITLKLGRDPSRMFMLTREDAQRLADVLQQADQVAGGAA